MQLDIRVPVNEVHNFPAGMIIKSLLPLANILSYVGYHPIIAGIMQRVSKFTRATYVYHFGW